MSVTTRLAMVAIAALLAPLSMAAPAHAATLTHTDPARDVYGSCIVPSSDPTDCPGEGVDSTRLDGDFRTTWVNHGTKNLVVKSHFSQLAAYQRAEYSLLVRTNTGTRYELRIGFSLSDSPYGRPVPYGTPPRLVKLDGNTVVSCSGLAKTVSYSEDTIETSIPRACLGTPYSVELQLVFRRYTSPDNDVDIYGDSAFDGFSPAIKRG